MARNGIYAIHIDGNTYYEHGTIPSEYKDLNGDYIPDSPNAFSYEYRDTLTGATLPTFGDPGNQYYLDVDGIYVPKGYGYLYYENIFGSGSIWYGNLPEGSYYQDNKGYFHEEGYGYIWDVDFAGSWFKDYGKIEYIEAKYGNQYIDLDGDAWFTIKPDALMLPEFLALFSDDQKEGHGLETHLVIQGKEVPASLAHKAYLAEYDEYDGLVKADVVREFVGKVAIVYQTAKTPTIVSPDPETEAQDSSNHYHTSSSAVEEETVPTGVHPNSIAAIYAGEEKAVPTEVSPNSIAAINQNKDEASSSLPVNGIVNISNDSLIDLNDEVPTASSASAFPGENRLSAAPPEYNDVQPPTNLLGDNNLDDLPPEEGENNSIHIQPEETIGEETTEEEEVESDAGIFENSESLIATVFSVA